MQEARRAALREHTAARRRAWLLAAAQVRVAGAGMVQSWSRWKLADGYTAVCANADCGAWAAAERIQ